MPRALLVTSGPDTGLAAQLEAARWTVRQTDPAEAETCSPLDPVDLVICPLHLADGADGAELLARLRTAYPEARALLTAEALAPGESQHLLEDACDVALVRVPASSHLLAMALSAAS